MDTSRRSTRKKIEDIEHTESELTIVNDSSTSSQMDATMDLMKQMLMEMRQKDEEDRRKCEQIREEERTEKEAVCQEWEMR